MVKCELPNILGTFKEFFALLAADQLMIEHGAGNVFQGFTEGEVKFPPTYK